MCVNGRNYVFWWTLEAIEFCWNFTLTFDLESYCTTLIRHVRGIDSPRSKHRSFQTWDVEWIVDARRVQICASLGDQKLSLQKTVPRYQHNENYQHSLHAHYSSLFTTTESVIEKQNENRKKYCQVEWNAGVTVTCRQSCERECQHRMTLQWDATPGIHHMSTVDTVLVAAEINLEILNLSRRSLELHSIHASPACSPQYNTSPTTVWSICNLHCISVKPAFTGDVYAVQSVTR